MRVVFFGTPAFAVPSLDALLAAGVEVAAVVTQPDRPRGRSRSTLVPSPVKKRAIEVGIEVLQPERPVGDVLHATLKHLQVDLGVVVAYGHILRPELIAIPTLGMVNVHASLLPRWRGAAPIQWALLAGDNETGVSIMRVEKGLDSGGVWLKSATSISRDDTMATLTSRLSSLGAEALLEALPRIANGVAPTPQPATGITLASKVDRSAARIRWHESTTAVSARIRAMDPAPGAWSSLGDLEIKCFSPALHSDPLPLNTAPGEMLESDNELIVATADGALKIREVQPAGKRRMPASDWLRGGAMPSGARFQ